MATSLLLALPQEIQDNILSYLLGNQRLHILLLTPFLHRFGLAYKICDGNNDAISKNNENVHPTANKDLKNNSEHQSPRNVTGVPLKIYPCKCDCSRWLRNGEEDVPLQHQRFSPNALAIFSTCRSLYATAVRTLYGTNLFAFGRCKHMDLFVSWLSEFQAAALRKIHLDACVSSYETEPWTLEQICYPY